MVFSSLTFLFFFLPILLIIYYLVPYRFKNHILLIASLIFYGLGEPKYLLLILVSSFVNSLFGLMISKTADHKRTILFILALLFNLGILCYFKYTDFIIRNINLVLHQDLPLFHILLPLGISFYTFQCLSYIIDVYTNKVQANPNLLEFTTYVTLFPQLIAGPIVRYQDVALQLKVREHHYHKITLGIQRFVVGLSKKVLLANTLGELVTSLQSANPSVLGYWFIAFAFLMQLYFDFSGYSDMAIGLGKMFGFEFPENFNYPLFAVNITDFWRRWHMSLSRWFKDYVYIPLKGSRVKPSRLVFNLLFVWILTGLWHGAEWNFLLWGVYFGLILIIEKMGLKSFLGKHLYFSRLYTILLVLIGFMMFQYDIRQWKDVFIGLFDVNHLPLSSTECLYYFKSYFIIVIVSIMGAMPISPFILNYFNKSILLLDNLKKVWTIILLLICIAFIVDSSFNPFLYFRF
ncbi:MBOAT family O-acyltransferase [Beduini massiliensis]|uniref:MBOAT family O-acyltransferase n=1 Tax=Beduini massiliensis TaxID=1585974 RepID=UPI00059A7F65|nr:MBOAT family O-acyltransferase [Beduini massiliensis]